MKGISSFVGRMRGKGYVLVLLAFATLVFVDVEARSYAQSISRSNPTPLRSREITGVANYPIPTDGSWGRVFYYEFTAGPGEMTATAITKGRGEKVQYNISFEEIGGSRIGETMGFLGGAAERRMSKSYSLGRRTRVLITVKFSGHFDYRIMLDGAVDIPRPDTNSSGAIGEGRNAGQGEDGPIMRLPNQGTLLIRMRDGSTREIDLSLVKEVKIVER